MALNYINKKYLLPLKVAIAETTGEDYEISLVLPDEIKEEFVETPSPADTDTNENVAKATQKVSTPMANKNEPLSAPEINATL